MAYEFSEPDLTDPATMRDYYDSNPNLLLSTLAGMAGLTVAEVKAILMHDD